MNLLDQYVTDELVRGFKSAMNGQDFAGPADGVDRPYNIGFISGLLAIQTLQDAQEAQERRVAA